MPAMTRDAILPGRGVVTLHEIRIERGHRRPVLAKEVHDPVEAVLLVVGIDREIRSRVELHPGPFAAEVAFGPVVDRHEGCVRKERGDLQEEARHARQDTRRNAGTGPVQKDTEQIGRGEHPQRGAAASPPRGGSCGRSQARARHGVADALLCARREEYAAHAALQRGGGEDLPWRRPPRDVSVTARAVAGFTARRPRSFDMADRIIWSTVPADEPAPLGGATAKVRARENHRPDDCRALRRHRCLRRAGRKTGGHRSPGIAGVDERGAFSGRSRCGRAGVGRGGARRPCRGDDRRSGRRASRGDAR
jgi:hypothetical protein